MNYFKLINTLMLSSGLWITRGSRFVVLNA